MEALGGAGHCSICRRKQEDSLPGVLRSLLALSPSLEGGRERGGRLESGESRGGFGPGSVGSAREKGRGSDLGGNPQRRVLGRLARREGGPCSVSLRWGAAHSAVRALWLGVGAPSSGHGQERNLFLPAPARPLPLGTWAERVWALPVLRRGMVAEVEAPFQKGPLSAVLLPGPIYSCFIFCL